MKPTSTITAFCGLFGAVAALQAAQIDVYNDASLTEFSTAGELGTSIRVIKADQTWTADNAYILTDRVFIPNGVTLTIEPGTTIYGSINENGAGKADDSVGSLIATRGGRLVAEGTAKKPIVFTSIRALEAAQGVDSPYDPDSVVGPAPSWDDAGHWGGLVLLGTSKVVTVDGSSVNAGTNEIEGFIPSGSPSNDGDSL
ncbi:MAG: hypothetical protein AAGI48_17475, partial [Verrucomicrobiota bacterium]